MNRTRWMLALGLLGIVAAVALAAWWRFGRAVPVQVVTITQGGVPVQVVGPGSVQARVPITLAARLTATVTAMHADVGDTVRAGQLLATLDDRDLAARRSVVASQRQTQQRNVEAAEAGLRKAQAEATLARSRQQRDVELKQQGFLSAAGLETSTAGLQAAEAAVQAAQAALAARHAELATNVHELQAAETTQSYTRLLAPADGLIVQRLAEPGSTVTPGSPLLKLVDPATVWVAMRVDEAMLARIQPGQPAQIRLRSGAVHTGRVARIARQSDAATREIDVHVNFDRVPAGFAIDQEAEVTVDTGSMAGLRMPVAALLIDRSGRRGVLVVEAGRTRFVPVRTGVADGDFVLVQQGLAAGDVVAAPAAGLRDGMRVSPQPGR
jgi:RND family efflux transporter MFP subunit